MSFPQLGYPQYLSAGQAAVYGGERPGVLVAAAAAGSGRPSGTELGSSSAAVTSVLGMYPYSAPNYSAFLPYTTDLTLLSQMSSSNNRANEARAVLLCHGKLHLRTLQEIFHFNTIEMKFGSKWIILTEDEVGFIPITFKANQKVVIREVTESAEPSEEPNCETTEPPGEHPAI